MILYSQADQAQKDNFFGLITGIFNLYVRQEKKHYHITKNDENISIKENSQEPPSASTRETFRTIMSNLKEMGLLEYTDTISNVIQKNPIRFFSVSQMSISKVNTELMDQLLDVPYEEISVQIPEHIQRHMSDFSPALREYIKKCLQENLREEFDNDLTSIVLRSIAPSPITLTRHLEIPVRLPNTHLGVSNEHYDLVELLKVRQNYDGTRNNPITREPFNLSQIIPAPDVLEQIKNRMLSARNGVPTQSQFSC